MRGSLNGPAAAEHALAWRNRDRSLPWARGEIFALALAGFVISLLAFWPGFMEFDSFDQYAQAIGKEQLNDWHPVILVFVWKLLIFVHDGPQLMLLLQLLLYWSGFLYLALHLLQRDKPWLAVAAIQGDLRSNSVWLPTFVWPAHENHVSTERGGGFGLPFCRSKFGHSVV